MNGGGYHEYSLVSWDSVADIPMCTWLWGGFMVCVKWFSIHENDIYIFTDTSPSRFRLVGSHFTKAYGTWSLKSPTTTKFTHLPHRYILIRTLSTFSVPQPCGFHLRKLDSESNSSLRCRTYRIVRVTSLCLRVLKEEALSRTGWETFDWYGEW